MNYNLSLISTKPDCQSLIDMANKNKDTLEYRRTGLVRQRLSATLTSAEIEANLLAITTELQALQAVYDGLQEGPTKDEIFNRIKTAEYKKFQLEQRKENYGVIALVQKEYDITVADRSIAETVDYISQLTVRLNELP